MPSLFSHPIQLLLIVIVVVPACVNRQTDSETVGSRKLAADLSRLDKESHKQAEPVLPDQIPADIVSFCSDCHALPNPDSFPREVWYDEIEKGYEFYARSGRTDLRPPLLQNVLKFYRQHAPEQIVFPQPAEVDSELRARFKIEQVNWKVPGQLSPAISCVRWFQMEPDGASGLVVTDMRDGSINLIQPSPNRSVHRLLGRVDNPARVTVSDLDQDGQTDFVVSDLGSFSPYDHTLGKVIWLHRRNNVENFETTVLASQLGRVADVSVADYAGDNQPDLVVAEFGHRKTGSLRLLTNTSDSGTTATGTGDSGRLRFESKSLDICPGHMEVLSNDWNGDGNMDFATITSQEFECVDLFINDIRKFNQYRVWTGRDLVVGSVGLHLADLDADGDQDILCVNGDCFDNNFANLSHGIQVMENLGNFRFAEHRLAELPGAYRAVTGDIDGDNDLDIIAVANLPTTVYPQSLIDQNPVSILVLEQIGAWQFRPRVLERGTPRYPALETADFNGDGKIDFAVGTQLFDTDPSNSPAAMLPRLSIWWQQ